MLKILAIAISLSCSSVLHNRQDYFAVADTVMMLPMDVCKPIYFIDLDWDALTPQPELGTCKMWQPKKNRDFSQRGGNIATI